MKHKALFIEQDLEFCKKYWDTYGFDYDTWRPGVIWPIYISMKELKENLKADGIKYVETEITFD